ncbi:MAG: hypothetical protein OHK0046_12250 [Anaerolineae bacterium]
MPVEFHWHDDSTRSILIFTTEDPWNWNDFHKAVRMSLFSLHRLGHAVDTILDLRQSTRTPAGAVGHLRSVGKPTTPLISGRAAVVGLDAETEKSLLAGSKTRVLHLEKQTIYFVDTLDEALAHLTDAP